METQFHIKVLLVGAKRYEFLKSDGNLTHLRIHANTWARKSAEGLCVNLAHDNPGKIKAAILQEVE